MKENLGQLDRKIRLGAGVLLLVISIAWTNFLAAILGAYALITALAGWCPFNAMFGFNTVLPSSEKKPEDATSLPSEKNGQN